MSEEMTQEATQEATIRVPLTVDDRAERADIMAGLLGEIEGVKVQAKAKAAEFRAIVDELEERLAQHGRVLREGAEDRHQMDLTFPQEEAARALHDVGAAACICEGGLEAEVKDPACPLHGVETRGETPAGDKEGAAAEIEADQMAPEVAPETPPVVEDFIAAQKARRRRA